MLDKIRRFLAGRTGNAADDAAVSRQPADVQVAACALLLELAYADGDFSPIERSRITEALQRHFGLEPAAAEHLMALADAERTTSIDHFQFTRVVADQYDLGQKMVLAEVMWGVVLADGQLAAQEAYLVRKIASLLALEPAYLAQARRTAGGA